MKIGLQTWGSEGDVRPFLALAAGLRRSGHDVTLAITSVENRDYNAPRMPVRGHRNSLVVLDCDRKQKRNPFPVFRRSKKVKWTLALFR